MSQGIDELEPCPFRGTPARGPIEQGNGQWRIYGSGYFIDGPSRETAITAWNTRTESSRLLAMKEALEEVVAYSMAADVNDMECPNCHDKGFEHVAEIRNIARTALADKEARNDG